MNTKGYRFFLFTVVFAIVMLGVCFYFNHKPANHDVTPTPVTISNPAYATPAPGPSPTATPAIHSTATPVVDAQEKALNLYGMSKANPNVTSGTLFGKAVR